MIVSLEEIPYDSLWKIAGVVCLDQSSEDQSTGIVAKKDHKDQR